MRKLRETFGKPLVEHQVIRHKLVDMAQRVAATQAYDRADRVACRPRRLRRARSVHAQEPGHPDAWPSAPSEAVQILGGAGFMRGGKVERIYREVKVNAIGGGAEEIMKDLAARQLGW